MPRNIEIKARIEGVGGVGGLARRVAALADSGPATIDQDDTFFRCPSGRLKLRTLSPDRGELIFYRRADEAGPKVSLYEVAATSTPREMRLVLAAAHGEIGRVRKRRLVFMAGRTRIHLDAVEGLGEFLELEVGLGDGEDEAAGMREAESLMRRLGIGRERLVRGAYLDLLRAAGREPGRAPAADQEPQCRG